MAQRDYLFLCVLCRSGSSGTTCRFCHVRDHNYKYYCVECRRYSRASGYVKHIKRHPIRPITSDVKSTFLLDTIQFFHGNLVFHNVYHGARVKLGKCSKLQFKSQIHKFTH